MAKSVSDLAREVITRLDRGEPMDEAVSMVLSGSEVEPATRVALESRGLRDAVVHEAFHELLEWHASFGGLAEFLEIDEAIHRTAERVGHDLDSESAEHPADSGSRLLH
jgi:hypothetical protein